MAYFFKQKLNLGELVNLEDCPKKVLIYEPDEYLGALYGHYLRIQNFDVQYCPDQTLLGRSIENFSPQVLVFSLDGPSGDFLPQVRVLLRALTKAFPNLGIVSTSYQTLNSQVTGEIMSLGLLGHISRRLSRPEDVATIVKSILQV